MAKQWTMPFLPANDGNKLLATYAAVGVGVLPDNIAIYIGDDVPTYPQNTIADGWRWLYNGIKDRNLLDGPPWAGAILYTGSAWNVLTANNRRTESDLATLTEDDVILAIGANVTATGDTNMLEDAFKRLIEFAIESGEIG